MPVGYHPLTHAERCQIHARLYRGWSKWEMARDPGRDPATISRETSRHHGQRGDRHQQADGKATARRQAASAVSRKITPERWAVVEDRRQAGGSPEPIAGRYQQTGEVMAGKEWIYPQVRADRQAGGTRYRCRRRRGKKPNGRGGRPAGRGHIPDQVDLAERPSVVAEKNRIGDWEREPILGARHRGRWYRPWIGARSFPSWSGWRARPRRRGTAALTRRLGPIRDRVHTGTADNGQEFARPREIAQRLDAGCYLATPYHSWERAGTSTPTAGCARTFRTEQTSAR